MPRASHTLPPRLLACVCALMTLGPGCTTDGAIGGRMDAADGRGPDLDPACATHEGNMVVTSATELAQLARYCEIRGNLTLAGQALDAAGADLLLARLTRVDGSLRIGDRDDETCGTLAPGQVARVPTTNRTLERLSLPALEVVGRELRVERLARLEAWAAGRLERVQALVIAHDPALTTLALPALHEAAHVVRIEDNAHLARVRMPALARAHRVEIDRNPQLAQLSLPRLARLGALTLRRNRLTAIELGALAEVEGSLSIWEPQAALALPALAGVGGTLSLRARSAELPALARVGLVLHTSDAILEALHLPVLAHVGSVVIERSALTTLALPNLRRIDSTLDVRDNPRLEALRLPALASVGREPPAYAPIQGDPLDWLRVRNNPRLQAVTLSSLAQVAGDCVIADRPALCEIGEVGEVGQLEVGGRRTLPARCER